MGSIAAAAAAAATSSIPPQLHRHRSPPPPTKSSNLPLLTRRSLLLLSTTTTTTPLFPRPAFADANPDDASTSPPPDSSPPTTTTTTTTTITDRVFMDFSICPSYFRSDRPLGSGGDPAACPDPEPLGRVVFGLYGKHLPITVANFKSMCTSSSYRGAMIHKVLQGQYFAAGRQGRKDRGEVQRLPSPEILARNTEVVDPRAFQLRHLRPGTLSLCLSENDDYDEIKLDPDYRNVEFLVTTGPGPCPQLDNQNIVFGTVLEGLDVVTTIATIPTYKPAERIRQFNDLAEFLGDERAQNARAMWNRPLKTVYISDCGELKVAKPSLSPSLP